MPFHRRFHTLLLVVLLSLLSIPATYQAAQARSSAAKPAQRVSTDSTPIGLAGSYGGWLRALAANDTLLYTAHSGGLAIFDISNPNQPVRRGHILLPSPAQVAEYANGTVYVATRLDLYAIDVTDPEQPTIRASSRLSGSPYNQVRDMQIAGEQLYLLYDVSPGDPDGDAEQRDLRIFDIGDPAQIVARGVYDDALSTAMLEVEVVGSFVYITRGANGLTIVNAGDPNNPTLHSQTSAFGRLFNMDGEGDRLYIGSFDSNTSEEHIQIIDVGNPGTPGLIDAYTSPNLVIDQLKVQDDRVYIADPNLQNPYNLRIFDVSDPANVTLLGSYATDLDPMRELLVAGDLVYFSSDYGYFNNGIQVVDVSNPAAPAGRGRIRTPTDAEGVDVAGSYAYVAAASDGLFTFDVSDPARPRLRSIFGGSPGYITTATVRDVRVIGNLAYLAADNRFKIVDVSNPDAPTLRSELEICSTRLQIIGNRAYLLCGNLVSIVNISDPSNPTVIVSHNLTMFEGTDFDMQVVGDRLYLSQGECSPNCLGGFQIFDISNVANPVRLSAVSGPYGGLEVLGNLLYVQTAQYLYIYDVTNPANPTLRSTRTASAGREDLKIVGQYVYFAGSFRGGLQIADLSMPTSPKLRASFSTAITGPLGLRTNTIKVEGDLVYVADATNGLLIFRVDPAQFPPTIFAPIVGKSS